MGDVLRYEYAVNLFVCKEARVIMLKNHTLGLRELFKFNITLKWNGRNNPK